MIRRFPGKARLAPATIRIGTDDVPIVFRRHAQARRLVLRLNSDGSAVTVTVPCGVSRGAALDFASRSRGWIAERLAARGENIELRPGNLVPFRGRPHEIRHVPSVRGAVLLDEAAGVIHVPGDLPHVSRRLVDWMKRMARQELTAAVNRHAGAMGVRYRRITLRDQKSRWGSCSASGELSFSWRLILAPPHVLDYVAAHEVAHLRHMDHGPRFWRLVLGHCPEAALARTWLRTKGPEVHRIVLRPSALLPVSQHAFVG